MDLQIRGLYSQRYTANTWRYLQRASSEVHLLYSTQFQFTTDTRNNWHMWMGWASCSRRTEPGQKRGTQQWNCLNVIASNFYFQQSSKTTVNSHRVVIRFRTKKKPRQTHLSEFPLVWLCDFGRVGRYCFGSVSNGRMYTSDCIAQGNFLSWWSGLGLWFGSVICIYS